MSTPADSSSFPMQILFLTSGPQVPSTRFRVLQYLPGLEAAGHKCLVAHSRPPKYQGWRPLGNRLSDIPRTAFRLMDWLRCLSRKPDVVVVERELFSSGFWLPERLFRGIAPAMVLDVDDGIFLAHPGKFRGLAAMCDGVIAGNPLLAQRAAMVNPHVTIVPTCLAVERYAPRPKPPQAAVRPVLGWTGTKSNLPSLRLISGALQALRRTHDFELAIIAEAPPDADELGLSGIALRYSSWREESEISDLHRFDIGLMPLEDSEWTRSKCGLKILQYMAIGIPAVASPVGVNCDIVQHGENGLLASTASDWTTHLARLIEDEPWRTRLGAAGRATIEERFSVEGNLPKFEAALRASTIRGRNTPAAH